MPLSTSEFVDGGVIANSPSWIALTTAIARFGWKADSIRMVVVGTTTSPQGRVPSQPATARWKRALLPFQQGQGYWYWLRKHRLLNLLMNGQQRLADEMSRQALEPGHFWAINSFRSPEQDKVAKTLDQASVAATGDLEVTCQDCGRRGMSGSQAATSPQFFRNANRFHLHMMVASGLLQMGIPGHVRPD